MRDSSGRTIDYLRISVTDRCNARCVYCMPQDGVKLLPHSSILTYEEITFFVKICAEEGIKHVRLTGGDPLVRKDIAKLIAMIRIVPGIEDVRMTTNGLALEEQLPGLVAAGLTGVNISLDAIDEKIFSEITRLPEREHGAAKVLHAVDMALSVPNLTVKINCVPSGRNDKELVPIALLAKDKNVSVRFIELMPIGCGTTPRLEFRSRDTVFQLLNTQLGSLLPCGHDRYEYFRPAGFRGTIGFISPVTRPFCSTCDRLRLTSDGFIKACLEYPGTSNIKRLLAGGMTDQTARKIRQVLFETIAHKPDGNNFGCTGQFVTVKENRTMNQIGG